MRSKSIIIMAVLLIAAVTAAFGQAAPKPGTIVLSYRTEPITLNPMASEDSSAYFVNLLFNGLAKYNENGELIPDLAEKWETPSDGLIWTFHLRKNILFHDGTELTSEDVLATYKAAVDPSSNLPIQSMSDIIQGFDAPDRYTFRALLNKPYAPFLSRMTYEIVPSHLLADKHYMETDFSRNPIGTGPYRLKKQVPGEITLAVFDKYFSGKPKIDTVIFKLIPDQKKAWTSFIRGEIDLIQDIDYSDYLTTGVDSRFQTFQYLDGFNYTLTLH